LFADSKVILIRNADAKLGLVEELASSLLENPIPANALVIMAKSWNKTTKLGKLIKKSFTIKELSKPEIKPFDLLDSLNFKNTARVIQQSNLLFAHNYNPLALFSLLSGHLILLRKIKEHQGASAEVIAREIKQHVYRVKKTLPALREWSSEDIDNGLKEMQRLDRLLRTWQYDEKMLIQMSLIRMCTL
jgi:DNA polymerase III delta subunit